LASRRVQIVLALEIAPRGGRPTVPLEIRELIREMSIANPLWGAPRIHGELLQLGIEIRQTSVAKYMTRRRGPRPKAGRRSSAIMPTASWRWFLSFDNLVPSALWLVDHHGAWPATDSMVWSHPSAEWIANQLVEACGWEQTPRYLIRDRDGGLWRGFHPKTSIHGIRDRPTWPRSPWLFSAPPEQ
jgi:hypothetical protein